MNTYLSYQFDALSLIMLGLIFYIGCCILSFSSRYMKGDPKYPIFLFRIIFLILSITIMVSTDHIFILLLSISFSHFILIKLMVHSSKWQAAKASGKIASHHFLLSSVCMGIAFFLFYLETKETHISSIINPHNQNFQAFIGSFIGSVSLILLLISAMTQSGIWPFHKWLLSSLNSPTLVSAIMHAGLINGGGFVLIRFAPLYLQNQTIMLAVFCMGMLTALLGTSWKLIQNDVKKMLACSTMGQMGFMFVQCGLGLFPLALTHLLFHGLFKSYLFLASSSAAQEKRLKLAYPPSVISFVCALLCGTLGSFSFSYASHETWFASDSTLVLIIIVLIAGTQLALPILQGPSFKIKSLICALFLNLGAGTLYGLSVYFIVSTLETMQLMRTQSLNSLHIVGCILFSLSWLVGLFLKFSSTSNGYYPAWVLKIYVKALNASQPAQGTITAYRNHYQYQ
ncbi:MAG: proton-conducting transporter membrane subunit [Gammaproteobacteria bacterium]